MCIRRGADCCTRAPRRTGLECARQKQLVPTRSCLGEVLCSKRRAYAFFGEWRGVDRVVHEPRAVIFPEVMVWVCRIKPNG
jgi:hypothetical protein